MRRQGGRHPRRAGAARAHGRQHPPLTSWTKAQVIGRAARAKHAEDVLILDMRRLTDLADFLILCSGSSRRQTRAIADGIRAALGTCGAAVWRTDGEDDGQWIVLDCSDAIAHVFVSETRAFYGLERLWGDAPRKSIRDGRVRTSTT